MVKSGGKEISKPPISKIKGDFQIFLLLKMNSLKMERFRTQNK